MALPTEAYYSVPIVSTEGNVINNFVHLPSSVEAFEPEEVGVEHLLREIKDISLNSLSNKVKNGNIKIINFSYQVNQKINSLKGLSDKMKMIKTYLDKAILEKDKVNSHEIIYNLQVTKKNIDIVFGYADL